MGRNARWQTKAVVSAATATAAGSLAGLLAGAIGSATPVSLRAGLGTGAGLALAILPLSTAALPQRNRETPQALLGGGPLFWSATNGALLGLAVSSRIGFWLWYVIPLGSFISASPITGAAIWGFYGFARLTVLGLIAMRIGRSNDSGNSITSGLIESGARVRAVMTPLAAVTGLATAFWIGF
jgi:hypothetical protein